MTDTIRAPWTSEQVAALNAFQQRGGMHQFMCGALHTSGLSPVLDATHSGWICPDPACDYRQDWAHAFMADPAAWPWGERHGPTPEEAHVLIASATHPTPDPITALLAHLEAEQAKAQRTADVAGRRPADDLTAVEARYAASGMACGLRTAAILTVGHLRGADARDAYIAATEGQAADTDAPSCSSAAEATEPDNRREQYARALAAFDTSGFPWGTLTPGQVRTYEESADIVLAVRDTELERLRARIAELEAGEAADRVEILWLMNHNDRNCVVVLERDRLSLALEAADQTRAEVQRDRDQHAAVLREVLSRFRAGDGEAPEAWATREDLDRWRSVVAPTVERPWWEQVREWEEAAVDATHHVLELKATLARVRAVVDRIKVGAPWAANQADITARLQAALDGEADHA